LGVVMAEFVRFTLGGAPIPGRQVGHNAMPLMPAARVPG
jgi:hypothetical protein